MSECGPIMGDPRCVRTPEEHEALMQSWAHRERKTLRETRAAQRLADWADRWYTAFGEWPESQVVDKS